MKRALKKREKAVLKNNPSGDDTLVEHLEHLNINIVVNPKVKRRVRTKAAVIGLAISMGATSLLVTRQSDQAQAADPLESQKAASTIPAAFDTTVKIAHTTLKTQTVLPGSLSENPVIVEPTAISQLPGLEAKWQVAASEMSVQVPVMTSELQQTASDTTSLKLQSPVSQGLSTGIQRHETVTELSSADSVNYKTEGDPQVLENTDPSSETNAQLKAQQEFALNRLQEKSNRLRNSLAELRSEETQVLSKTDIALTQPNKTETAPEISASLKAVEATSTVNNQNTEDLVSRLKQRPETGESNPQPLTKTVPATQQVVALLSNTAYEVKPGDTLAAIAGKYHISVSELIRANNLHNPNQLKISQKLIIPVTPVNRSRSIQIPVVVDSNSAYSNAPQSPNYPVNISSNYPDLPPAASQLPGTVNNLIEVNTVSTETESISPNAQGIGGDIPAPTLFTEMQEAKQSPEQTPSTTENEHLSLLRAEVERLQEKHRNQQSGNITQEALTEPEKTAVLTPIPQTNSLQEEIRKLQEKYRSQQSGNGNRVSANEVEEVPVALPIAQTTSPEAEIQRLREQYRQQQSGNTITPAATESEKAPTVIPSRSSEAAISINVPSLNSPGSQSANSQIRTRRPNEPINPEFSSSIKTSGSRTPIFPSNNNSDTLGELRGSRVAPQFQLQLPPLAAVEQYLPKPIDATTPPPSTGSTAYMWPAKGVLTSGYGRRWGRMHRGIDIANATGTPVFAAADGVVAKSGWNRGGFGILVEIRHPDGSMTRYAHNSRTLVRTGQQVTQGQQIADMGSTGFSTGPHTHFEIHPPGKGAIDPIAFLPKERL
ncbi:peptidoglycan DD-metalloendopeptidase family protein [Nodularia harveyana UHCC-0300]|uniref:Peptidoglycan DD-metalloendopeptidase family protein n=1 Tax=Nodularia harveyana UHCC-0300 TaxID=2974287 RepID=A0ABU5UA05_9CYAN|nr:peptidoglycan DD-metalloendopeptidase family protein [Nodularia harveyana]MEA5580352.1 peptidoglycan DD-metalloendopeptidase family protein [Nodularia harveyana UHCC-0300]